MSSNIKQENDVLEKAFEKPIPGDATEITSAENTEGEHSFDKLFSTDLANVKIVKLENSIEYAGKREKEGKPLVSLSDG